ncbi:hypothetical protein F2P81_011819 [Scophthalmus maximus]|uniref:Uncharacterized protein n=1 Tax=Scophthalmus maximus TaxID=52904 RepID=A0A6A4SSV7_SCOMX|nr:hypothetical protein F2P81_011819 [Scophthalmus maximus]
MQETTPVGGVGIPVPLLHSAAIFWTIPPQTFSIAVGFSVTNEVAWYIKDKLQVKRTRLLSFGRLNDAPPPPRALIRHSLPPSLRPAQHTPLHTEASEYHNTDHDEC